MTLFKPENCLLAFQCQSQKKSNKLNKQKIFVPCVLLRNLWIKNPSARVRLLLNPSCCRFQQDDPDSVFPALPTCCGPNPARERLRGSGWRGCRAACAPLTERQVLSRSCWAFCDLGFRLLFMSFAIQQKRSLPQLKTKMMCRDEST